MTTDAMEQLRALTSNSVARAAELDRKRSSFRSPLRNWAGLVEDIIGPYEVSRGGFTRQAVTLRCTSLTVTKSDPPYTSDSADIEMNLGKTANVNSEIGQMVASAALVDGSVDSLLDLKGKWLTCEEAVHEFAGREQVNGTWGDTTFTTYYYKVVGIGKGGRGMAAAVTEANPDVLAAVVAYASGLTSEQFTKGVLKDVAGAAQDVAVRSAIIANKFLGEQVEAGRLTVADGVYVAV